MNKIENKETWKIQTKIGWYNMVANLFWTALFLTPISVFCYGEMSFKLISIFLAVSLLPIFLPTSFFDRIQLSKSPSLYRKIGVKFINKFTQNGDTINRLIRRKNPQYKVVINQNLAIKKLISQTYMFEKFHFSLFLFFTLATGYASLQTHFKWAFILLISNVAYMYTLVFCSSILEQGWLCTIKEFIFDQVSVWFDVYLVKSFSQVAPFIVKPFPATPHRTKPNTPPNQVLAAPSPWRLRPSAAFG